MASSVTCAAARARKFRRTGLLVLPLFSSFLTDSCHFSDSGTNSRMKNVSSRERAGEHDPAPGVPRSRLKTVDEGDECETDIGRRADQPRQDGPLVSGQHSMMSATPSDHSPPMPSAARSGTVQMPWLLRKITNACENRIVQHAETVSRAHGRICLPSQPNASPPAAAPKRNNAVIIAHPFADHAVALFFQHQFSAVGQVLGQYRRFGAAGDVGGGQREFLARGRCNVQFRRTGDQRMPGTILPSFSVSVVTVAGCLSVIFIMSRIAGRAAMGKIPISMPSNISPERLRQAPA